MAGKYDYSDKAALLYVLDTIRDKIRGYLEGYVTSDTLKKELDALGDMVDSARVTVDTVLNGTSTNPIQNMAVAAAIENLESKKAGLASPEFSGTPLVPTALEGTSSLQVANTAFVQQALNTALAGITGIDMQVCDALPDTGKRGTFYFVQNSGSGSQNFYDEYAWVNGKWELLGNTTVDLSGYLQESQLVPITTTEIDAMFENW